MNCVTIAVLLDTGEKNVCSRFYMLERVSKLPEFNTVEVEQFWTGIGGVRQAGRGKGGIIT